MPVLKHAKKKKRQDKKRTLQNKRVKAAFKLMVKKARQNPSNDVLSKSFRSIDIAVKKNIIHKNKAARLKSGLFKLKQTNGTAKVPAKVTKTVTKKGPIKKSTKK